MVLNRSSFQASTRPQHVGPNNNNKHPSVELVPQCEDLNEEHVELPRHTVRGNPIPHSLFFSPFLFPSPLFSYSFFLTLFCFSLDFLSLSFYNLTLVFYVCLSESLTVQNSQSLSSSFLFLHRIRLFIFSIVPEQVSHCQQENYTSFVFYLIYTLVIHPLFHSLQLVLDLVVYTYLLGHAMQYVHKDMWE